MRSSLLALTVLLGACTTHTPEPASPAVELLSGAEVTISPELKSCSVDAECTLVSTGCDFCCQRQAINTTYVNRYREEFAEACAGYSGGVCDCIETPADARCIDRTCTIVPRDR